MAYMCRKYRGTECSGCMDCKSTPHYYCPVCGENDPKPDPLDSTATNWRGNLNLQKVYDLLGKLLSEDQDYKVTFTLMKKNEE